MTLHERMTTIRRTALLKAIPASDLKAMYVKVTGLEYFLTTETIRNLIFRQWDAYTAELANWCDATITGESTLEASQ